MFTIIISEKGGGDRREAFDRNEINVGRVQGNDLMLAKGNVSKHHARLLYRDGRFIVTDLKSTNGTYVNGRKISQATIVREGDKIYVGDFVLRLETGRAEALQEAAGEAGARPSQAPAHAERESSAPGMKSMPTIGAAPSNGPPASPAKRAPELQSTSHVSHFPLERDPESESAPDMVDRVSGPAGAPGAKSSPSSPDRTGPRLAVRHAPTGETPQQAAYARELAALVDRVAAAVDLRPLAAAPVPDDLVERIEGTVRAQVQAQRPQGIGGEPLELDRLERDALRELLGLGPIGPLLEDDDTVEVRVARYDEIVAVGAAGPGAPSFVSPAFTSEEALARAVARLAARSGEPLRKDERVVERRIGRALVVALAPAVAGRWIVTIRKRQRLEASLASLRRARALSGAMAAFLEACVDARANVLVVGGGAAAVHTTIAALTSAAAAGERVAVIGGDDEIAAGEASVLALGPASGERAAESIAAARRVGAERLAIPSLTGAAGAAVIEAIGEGCEGVVAGIAAPSLRQALARLAVQVAMARPGIPLEAAREAVGESFDVAVELSRPGDGRLRVLRIAELAGSDVNGVVARDLFLWAEEAPSDASAQAFVATGIRPQLARDFAARGIKLDEQIFRRTRPQGT